MTDWAILDRDGRVCGTMAGTPLQVRIRLATADRMQPSTAPHFAALQEGDA